MAAEETEKTSKLSGSGDVNVSSTRSTSLKETTTSTTVGTTPSSHRATSDSNSLSIAGDPKKMSMHS